MDPKNNNFGTSFGHILGSTVGPKTAPKWEKNGTTFGTPLRRISGVRELRFQELNESGEIAIATGIILAKRKGGINKYQLLPIDEQLSNS